MTFDEMKYKIKQKFEAMKIAGLIITSEEFEKIKGDYFSLRRTNLTRIWCVDYLKEKLKASNLIDNYDFPEYIIVLKPNTNKITIKWYFSNTYLFPLAQEIVGADIYFKEIKGKDATNPDDKKLVSDIGPGTEIGFRDSGYGNIIQENETGKYYIVDTEFNSFYFPKKDELSRLMTYSCLRFRYLNNNISFAESEIEL